MSAEEETPKKPATEAEAIAALRYALQEQDRAGEAVRHAREDLRIRDGDKRRADYLVEQSQADLLELLNPGSGRNVNG